MQEAGIDPAALLDTYIGAINAIARDRPAGMTIALHLCKGNYKGHWMAEGSYEAVSEKLFNEAEVDTFFLEYESERAGGFEPLRHVPKNKNVILGLVSSKTPKLEELDALKRRVDEAARFMPLDQAGVSPQCGFASSVGGNPLSIDDERRKLASRHGAGTHRVGRSIIQFNNTDREPSRRIDGGEMSYVFPQLAGVYAALGPWVDTLMRVVRRRSASSRMACARLRHVSRTPACRSTRCRC